MAEDGRDSDIAFTVLHAGWACPLGHENAGWVQRLGAGVIGFAPGDPVIVYGSWGCGVCATADMAGRNVVGSRAAKPPEPQPAAV
ncbi:alcohol dehydrogenase catalytic domain-containing protein [Streptomyces sp. NPDC007856]|uniref:alcohol dehydrogenase catalytic domain-containing protein n=1 Tax=Streptomyces sp. NPDC007856 TaxID=3364781 RepID=UPI0036AE5C0E